MWLTPLQVMILPISDKYTDYCKEVAELFKNADIRAEIDERNEKIGRKIRDAEMMKTPYMLIIGEKEAESRTVAVRVHGQSVKAEKALTEPVVDEKQDATNAHLPEGVMSIQEFINGINGIVKEQIKGKAYILNR